MSNKDIVEIVLIVIAILMLLYASTPETMWPKNGWQWNFFAFGIIVAVWWF